MNDVHSTVARKLRSAAAALRADIEATHFVNLRDALLAEVVVIEKRAAAIEEQAKPGAGSLWDTAKAAFWDLVKPTVEEDPDPQSTAEATAVRTEWIRRNRPDEWR